MNQPVEGIYEYWTEMAFKAALFLVVLSSFYYIAYVIISSVIGNRSKKYKFVQSYETSIMWHASIGFCIAIAMIVSSLLLNERDLGHMFILSLKSALSIGVAITVGFAMRSYLTIYYPFLLEKKLADIRFRERKNPKTSKPMRLLNEEEEDNYLTDEMIRQEEEFRFDYDVWLDESNNSTIIETYLGSTNKICGKCHFRTLKLVKEEKDEDSNYKILHYECSHCKNKIKEQDF